MDTGRLLGTAEYLLADEADFKIDTKVQAVLDAVSTLANQPADQTAQSQLQGNLRELADALEHQLVHIDPIFASYARAVGGYQFFSVEMLRKIEAAIAENAMTPAVARDAIQEIQEKRQGYLTQLRALVKSMKNLSIESDDIDEGEAQIGFRIPRELFHNDFVGWIRELNEIKRIVRPFSELATGGAEPLKLGEVSSTDPIVFIGLAATTVASLSKAVSWCLDSWKRVEEIRKLRAETAEISAKNAGVLDDIAADMDARIAATIEQAISDHAKELVAPTAAGRGHEQVTAIEISLRSLLARIERGMTVELKFLPSNDSAAEPEEVRTAMSDIELSVQALTFPVPSAIPIIALPAPEGSEPRRTGQRDAKPAR